IGASAFRIARQLLTESALLGLLGGALGVLCAFCGVAAVRALGTKSVPRLAVVGLDPRALLFTLAVSLAAAALFGLAPALGAPPAAALRSRSRRCSRGDPSPWRVAFRLRARSS